MKGNLDNREYKIPDTAWKKIKRLLPPDSTYRKNHLPIDDRKAMEAILYVFRNGCKWNEIPPELGSESIIYSRFKEWQSSGLYQRMWISGFLTYDELRKLVWYGK